MNKDRRFLYALKESCELTMKYYQKDIDYAWKKGDNDGRYHDETSEEVARLDGGIDEAYVLSEMIREHLGEDK